MSGKKERELRREERVRLEDEAQAAARRKRLQQLAAVGVFAAILILAVAIVATQGGGSGGDTSLEEVGVVEEQLAGIPQRGTALGDPSATVTLVEFGDLQCPICKAFSEEVLPRVIAGPVKRGEATIDFRNFTIISEQSVPAGAAALAAGEQGRGWNYIDVFYRNQGEERSGYVTDAFLTSIAKGAMKRAGKVRLTVKAVGRAAAKLKQNRRAKVKAKITFNPTGGDPKAKTKKLTLKLS